MKLYFGWDASGVREHAAQIAALKAQVVGLQIRVDQLSQFVDAINGLVQVLVELESKLEGEQP